VLGAFDPRFITNKCQSHVQRNLVALHLKQVG
jgi:hypothetical protein